MRPRLVRISAGTAVVLALSTSGALLGAGVAGAAPEITLGSCNTTVQGSPGQPVGLSQSAVVAPVTNVVRGIPLLGPAAADTVANTMNSWGPMQLPAIPGAGSSTVSGNAIADQVIQEINGIPVLGLALGLVDSGVRSSLSTLCSVTEKVLPPPPPPPPTNRPTTQPAPPPPGGQPGGDPTTTQNRGPSGGVPAGPGGSGLPGGDPGSGTVLPGGSGGFPGTSLGTVPSYDFTALPGAFTAPNIDYSALPSVTDGPGGQPNGYADSPNNVAGQANLLNAASDQGIQLPIAVAVLALGAVTAALVRSFVLRRSASH